jgi:hypothetical protein
MAAPASSRNFAMTVLDDKPLTPVQRTELAMRTTWAHMPGRVNQGRAFLKRAKKSDARRKVEKASRKRNRR